MTLDKGPQCSDWAQRPLSMEQLDYAALDAAACLHVLDAMELDWAEGGGGAPLDELLRTTVNHDH